MQELILNVALFVPTGVVPRYHHWYDNGVVPPAVIEKETESLTQTVLEDGWVVTVGTEFITT